MNAWKYSAATNNCAALSWSGPYVISHRPKLFTLSYRPPNQHVPLGQFSSLKKAKAAAELDIDRRKAA